MPARVNVYNEYPIGQICYYTIYMRRTQRKAAVIKFLTNEYQLIYCALFNHSKLVPNEIKETFKRFIWRRTHGEPFLFERITGFIIDAHQERRLKHTAALLHHQIAKPV